MERNGNLVLARRETEAVFLRTADGTEIGVHVVKAKNGRVELMFVAPRSVEILRDNAVVKTTAEGRT